jgi:hypothetical protein
VLSKCKRQCVSLTNIYIYTLVLAYTTNLLCKGLYLLGSKSLIIQKFRAFHDTITYFVIVFQYCSSVTLPFTEKVIRNSSRKILSKCPPFISKAYTVFTHTVNVLMFYLKNAVALKKVNFVKISTTTEFVVTKLWKGNNVTMWANTLAIYKN